MLLYYFVISINMMHDVFDDSMDNMLFIYASFLFSVYNYESGNWVKTLGAYAGIMTRMHPRCCIRTSRPNSIFCSSFYFCLFICFIL